MGPEVAHVIVQNEGILDTLDEAGVRSTVAVDNEGFSEHWIHLVTGQQISNRHRVLSCVYKLTGTHVGTLLLH